MNLKRKIREELNKTGEPKTGYEVHGFTKDNERLKEIEEAGCRYCTFVYNPDGSVIADENGEELLDCWFDDCNASVVPGTWCEDCPKGVKDTKDMKGGSTRRGKVKSNYTKANVSIKEYTRNRTNIDSFLNEDKEDKPKGKRKGSTPRPSDKAMMNMTKKVLGGVTPSTGMNNWWCCLVACNNPGCKGDRWEVVMNPWG